MTTPDKLNHESEEQDLNNTSLLVGKTLNLLRNGMFPGEACQDLVMVIEKFVVMKKGIDERLKQIREQQENSKIQAP